MPNVTFIREKKLIGSGVSLIIKLDKNKFKLKNGKEITVETTAGKHKVRFRPSMGILFFLALFRFRGGQLKYKFKLAENEDMVIKCGPKGGGVFYESEIIQHGE